LRLWKLGKLKFVAAIGLRLLSLPPIELLAWEILQTPKVEPNADVVVLLDSLDAAPKVDLAELLSL